mgnify:CR=1 FL=1
MTEPGLLPLGIGAGVALSARHGDIEQYFIESLLQRLPGDLAGFLTRIAILDPVSAELAEAVTGQAQASAWLWRKNRCPR